MGQRHWQQVWDPNPPFVFRQSLLIEGKRVAFGDPVTPELRKSLGMNRLRRWWDAKVIEIADFDPATRTTSEPVAKEPLGPEGKQKATTKKKVTRKKAAPKKKVTRKKAASEEE